MCNYWNCCSTTTAQECIKIASPIGQPANNPPSVSMLQLNKMHRYQEVRLYSIITPIIKFV
jgi:ribosomal protein L30/L7E